MCWVMPPASPLTTLVSRMASSSEVLPWSTWPMMVTIGARGSMSTVWSSVPMKPSSTSASDTRLGVWPNSRTISSAVSLSTTSVILCIVALLHQVLDDVDAALGHAVGEVLDGDRFRNHHFAHDLFARLLRAQLTQPLTLAAALGGGLRTVTLLHAEDLVEIDLARAHEQRIVRSAGGSAFRLHALDGAARSDLAAASLVLFLDLGARQQRSARPRFVGAYLRRLGGRRLGDFDPCTLALHDDWSATAEQLLRALLRIGLDGRLRARRPCDIRRDIRRRPIGTAASSTSSRTLCFSSIFRRRASSSSRRRSSSAFLRASASSNCRRRASSSSARTFGGFALAGGVEGADAGVALILGKSTGSLAAAS